MNKYLVSSKTCKANANDVFSVTSCNDDSPVRIFYGGLRIIISKLRIGDPNLQFKLLKIITQIIFLDKKDLYWKMDSIIRKSMKRIWISNFPPTLTVCAIETTFC